MKAFNTPIVLIIYKRSSTLSLIIDELRKINASKIYVIADGPRNNSEASDVSKARSIIDSVDWVCEVVKIYSTENLGLYKRWNSGLDEVFVSEKNAIILEDDCVPNSSFFEFSSKMLDKYNKNSEIFMIGGSNLGLNININYDYDFCSYPLIWGWATWQRSWKEFRNIHPLNLTPNKLSHLKGILNSRIAFFHWKNLFTKLKNGTILDYGHEIAFHLLTSNKLCVIPRLNLVSNQGVDLHATHTKKNTRFFYLKLEEFNLSLQHPGPSVSNPSVNKKIERYVFTGGLKSFLSYVVHNVLILFKGTKSSNSSE